MEWISIFINIGLLLILEATFRYAQGIAVAF
jgi:hypothetical protein